LVLPWFGVAWVERLSLLSVFNQALFLAYCSVSFFSFAFFFFFSLPLQRFLRNFILVNIVKKFTRKDEPMCTSGSKKNFLSFTFPTFTSFSVKLLISNVFDAYSLCFVYFLYLVLPK
jgi:hypothetical protein